MKKLEFSIPTSFQIASTHKNQIAREFKTSRQTVFYALNYRTNSKQAIQIRQRAKTLLLQEIQKIDFFFNPKFPKSLKP